MRIVYRTDDEQDALAMKARLESAGMFAHINGLYTENYIVGLNEFLVYVHPVDLREATILVARHVAENASDPKRTASSFACPKCGTENKKEPRFFLLWLAKWFFEELIPSGKANKVRCRGCQKTYSLNKGYAEARRAKIAIIAIILAILSRPYLFPQKLSDEELERLRNGEPPSQVFPYRRPP